MLRFALYEVWGPRCYWCHKPCDFTDVAIDHIIPQHPQGISLAQALRDCGKPGSFDINSPANLAPICTICNGRRGKGALAFAAPRLLSELAKAQQLSAAVEAKVAGFGRSDGVARQLIDAAAADLSDANARRAYLDHAPAVVQRLALLDEQLLDVLTRRSIRLSVGGQEQVVGLALNAQARAIVTLIEDVCGSDMVAGLAEPIRGLINQVYADTRHTLEAGYGPSGPRNAGEPEADYFDVEIGSLTCERIETTLEFTASGSFEASLSASVVQDSLDGSELDELQGDVWMKGTFTAPFSWDMTDPDAGFHPGEGTITSSDVDSSIW